MSAACPFPAAGSQFVAGSNGRISCGMGREIPQVSLYWLLQSASIDDPHWRHAAAESIFFFLPILDDFPIKPVLYNKDSIISVSSPIPSPWRMGHELYICYSSLKLDWIKGLPVLSSPTSVENNKSKLVWGATKSRDKGADVASRCTRLLKPNPIKGWCM